MIFDIGTYLSVNSIGICILTWNETRWPHEFL